MVRGVHNVPVSWQLSLRIWIFYLRRHGHTSKCLTALGQHPSVWAGLGREPRETTPFIAGLLGEAFRKLLKKTHEGRRLAEDSMFLTCRASRGEKEMGRERFSALGFFHRILGLWQHGVSSRCLWGKTGWLGMAKTSSTATSLGRGGR